MFSLTLGVGTGIIHHLAFQWPHQKSLFSALGGLVAENVAFLALICSKAAWSKTSFGFLMFILFFSSEVVGP